MEGKTNFILEVDMRHDYEKHLKDIQKDQLKELQEWQRVLLEYVEHVVDRGGRLSIYYPTRQGRK